MYLLWLLATYGIFFFVLRSSLSFKFNFKRLVSWNPLLTELWDCAFCSGFWVGIATYLVIFRSVEWSLLSHLLWGFASAAFCYTLENINVKLEK